MPLKIVTDEREYLDDGTLDAVEMATALRTYKGKTSTSCPNIGDWVHPPAVISPGILFLHQATSVIYS